MYFSDNWAPNDIAYDLSIFHEPKWENLTISFNLVIWKGLNQSSGAIDWLVQRVDVGQLLQQVNDGHGNVGVVVRQETEKGPDRLELDKDGVQVRRRGDDPQVLDGVVELDLWVHELGGLVGELDAKFLKKLSQRLTKLITSLTSFLISASFYEKVKNKNTF